MNAATRQLTVVRAAEIAAPDHATPAWLIEHLWGSGAVGVIGGAPKCGKSWLALELAVAVASGRPCLGRFAVPTAGPVLLYAAEDTPLQVRQRIEQLCQARGAAFDTLELGLILEPSLRIDRAQDVERLDEGAVQPLGQRLQRLGLERQDAPGRFKIGRFAKGMGLGHGRHSGSFGSKANFDDHDGRKKAASRPRPTWRHLCMDWPPRSTKGGKIGL